MGVLLSLVFAATLSSSNLGEFMTLPSWMPTSVGSEDTPGSFPDWYVEEFTNRIEYVDSWKVYANASNVIDGCSIPFVEQGSSNVYQTTQCSTSAFAALYPSNTIVAVRSPDIEGEGTEELLRWLPDVDYLTAGTNPVQKTMTLTMVATRTNNLIPIATGKWKPKAARLTPEVQAGVLSTFAGYFERQYYASQGQSNGWNEAVWGPKNRKKDFWFAPELVEVITIITNIYTNATYEGVSQRTEIVTNRTWEGDSTYQRYITTNSTWVADTDFGVYEDLTIPFRERGAYGRGWYCAAIGQSVASSMGVVYDDMIPQVFSGTRDDTNLTGSATLSYHVTTNYFTTNFTFEATRLVKISTNEYWTYNNEWAYRPTNRVVSARRLLEYDNIKGIANFVQDNLGQYGFWHRAAHRPGWIWSYGAEGDDMCCWWSSTEGRVMDGTDIVPTISSWTSDPTVGISNQWSKCSQVFACLMTNDVWYTDWCAWLPTELMMSRLDFGASNYNYSVCRPDTIDCTIGGLIETNYPHVDGWAITNQTRRLISDRLCNVNQMLGLMDRTYHLPDVIYPSVASNTYYQKGYFCSGTLTTDDIVFSNNAFYVITPDVEPSWDSERISNYVHKIDQECTGDSIHARISSTRTQPGCVVSMDESSSGVLIGDDEMVKSFVRGFGSPEGHFGMVIRGCDGVYRSLSDNYPYAKIEVAFWPMSGPVTDYFYRQVGGFGQVRVHFSYVRDYSYAHSEGIVRLGVTQPGWQSGSLSTSAFGSVYGVHFSYVGYNALEDMPYNPLTSLSRYRSASDDYSSRSDLYNQLYDIESDIYGKLADQYGIYPTEWSSIIPIDMSDVNSIKRSVRVKSLSYSFGKWQTETQIEGSVNSEGTVSIESVQSYDEGGWHDGYIGLLSSVLRYDVHHDSTEQVERLPLSMDAKIGVLTRTDWDWKVLKRTDDE